MENGIYDSFTGKKKPVPAETETGSSPQQQPLLQVVKVVSQELVKAKRFKQSPYEAQRTQQKLHTFWPPSWGPNLQHTYRITRAFSKYASIACEAAG